ncbi:MAG: amidophosphoribosyltransferase [Bacteroidetes bacterium]|jgi:amidophosphoribosyltransferase|nr:amidophosphoribosyltransferase [Bacteroidota bacterium]MBP7256441.1 amidophosphoribosyltransferase [Chitinophagales bacterium]
MSDVIHHECGIALIRLLKPFDYYKQKYGDIHYGLTKMYLLMEKQHNRGQDGAGLATVKFDMEPGQKYIDRSRDTKAQAIKNIFDPIFEQFNNISERESGILKNEKFAKEKFDFLGEVLLGHLRYATHGSDKEGLAHPRIRASNWMTRTLLVAGNFNLTNVDELFQTLIELGQIPREVSDTMTVLEKIGHFLDAENQRLFKYYKTQGHDNKTITNLIAENLDYKKILSNSAEDFDGGYVMGGLIGHGDAFVMRDPAGIRPAYYYKDDEIVVVASERPAIQTTFNVHRSKVHEIKPGHALIIKKDGSVGEIMCHEPAEKKSCSFERIYFSRGGDAEIYQERKKLGHLLMPKILKEINYDFENTVFSYIPNTAELAFIGLTEGIQKALIEQQFENFISAGGTDIEGLKNNLLKLPRIEKIAHKDVKLRTFITGDASRNDMVSHVYDVSYGLIQNSIDTIVALDDSIVRGTTLQNSILTMLDRLQPKKIVIVSSAPQIRYPDCYGIDMSKMGSFIAFQAAVALIKERKMDGFLEKIYKDCLLENQKPKDEIQNIVKAVYEPFSTAEISEMIAEIVKPKNIFSDVKIIYQEVDDLHIACPNHTGDWYFTGNYPTKGGNKVANTAFINYMEGKNIRAY